MNIDEEMKKFEQGFAYKPSMSNSEIEEELKKLNLYIKKIDFIFETLLDRVCKIEKHLKLYRKLDEK